MINEDGVTVTMSIERYRELTKKLADVDVTVALELESVRDQLGELAARDKYRLPQSILGQVANELNAKIATLCPYVAMRDSNAVGSTGNPAT